ncbi:MAG: hypothetical protein AAB654_07885 [Acidobacteriota bacterium]
MPSIARLTTIFALAAIQLCDGTILVGLAGAQPAEQREAPADKPMDKSRERPRPPPSNESKVELASDSKPFRQQCRIYFGCPPMTHVAAGTVQQ